MTLKGVIFLLGLTVATVMLAGWVAGLYFAPGIERTLTVAAITALVVFPAGWWAERRGWIKGKLQLNELPAAVLRKKAGGPQ